MERVEHQQCEEEKSGYLPMKVSESEKGMVDPLSIALNKNGEKLIEPT